MWINGNKIGNTGFAEVAMCVDKIDNHLAIGDKRDQYLSVDGTVSLFDAIRNRSHPVSYANKFYLFRKNIVQQQCIDKYLNKSGIAYFDR